MSMFLQAYIDDLPVSEACEYIPVTEGMLSDVIDRVKTFVIKIFDTLMKTFKNIWGKIVQLFRTIRIKIVQFLKRFKPNKESALTPFMESMREDGKLISIHAIRSYINQIFEFLPAVVHMVDVSLSSKELYTVKTPNKGLLWDIDDLGGATPDGRIKYPTAKELAAKKYNAAEKDGELVEVTLRYLQAYVDMSDNYMEDMSNKTNTIIETAESLRRKIRENKNTLLHTEITKEQQDIVKYNSNLLVSLMGFLTNMMLSLFILLDDNTNAVGKYMRDHAND